MGIHEEVFYFYGWIDKQGNLLDIHGEAFSHSPDSIKTNLGKPFHRTDFWQGESEGMSLSDPEVIQASVNEALQGKTIGIEADFFPHPERSEKIKLNLTPQYDRDIRVERVFFCALNISQYLNEAAFYKERSEQLLFAAETAEIGLFFWDLSKNDIFTTPRFNELYGLPPDEVMTREKFAKVVHPEDIGLVNETIQRSHTNFGECDTEYRVVLEDRTRWIWIRGKTFPGTENTAAFTMGSGRDVTDSKLAEEKLAELYSSEKDARDAVEKAILAKDQFIAMVSHELRAPLNSILGWVKILRTKEVDEETRSNALETIERSARSQAKLIGDLVDSSKIMSGKLNLEFHKVDLSSALAFVVEAQKPLAEAKNIQFDYFPSDDSVRVNADLSRLQQIFTNLVTNAIKFTPDNGRISIEFSHDEKDVHIRVIDTGRGIDPEELPFIFQRYFQARVNESRDKSGLGLGLSIVSTLVKQHGGDIRAESAGMEKGSVFTVTLPLLRTTNDNGTNDEAQQFQNDPLRDIRILLVEDNDDSREVLEIFLRQMGAEIISARSVAEAMEGLNSNGKLPHVLVSDISMPEEDGYSLLKKIRNLPAGEGGNMPAIALTAFASRDDKNRMLSAGFQLHHPKPFEPDTLIKEILKLVE